MRNHFPLFTLTTGLAVTIADAKTTAVVAQVQAASSSPSPVPSPTPCGNLGLEYAYYTDKYNFTNGSDYAASYKGYDPTILKRSKAIRETRTDTEIEYSYYTGGGSTASVSRGGKLLPTTFFALNYRGYVFTQYTGYYQFITQIIDDIDFVWVGANAYSGWNRGNANGGAQLMNNGTPGYNDYFAHLMAGKYVPFRVVFKQGSGNGYIDFKIIDPANNYLLGTPIDGDLPTNNVVRYSCDGKTAPPFPPYGQET